MPKFKMTKREREAQRAARRSEHIKSMFPEEPPDDMDRFRNMLARKIAMFIGARTGLWRGCPERSCRRQRACMAPHIHCSNAPPREPATPEEMARMMAKVQRAIRDFGEGREAE